MLAKIFRVCPAESHETLRHVSKRWKYVVDRYVGRVLIVATGNAFMIDPDSNMDRMSIRANYWMTLSSDQCPTASSSCSKTDNNGESAPVALVEEVEKLQDISNPESVCKIGFVGKLGLSGYKPLECIISPCKNITSLYLHLSLFSVLKNESRRRQDGSSWLASYCLPHLKDLCIDSSGVSCEDSSNIFSYKSTFLSLASFLCLQKFVCLEKAIISIPYMERVEGIMVRALCIFLGKHADTLKYFSFTQKYEYAVADDEDDENEESGNTDNDNHATSDHSQHHQGDGDRFAGSIDFSTGVNYLSLRQLALSSNELKNVVLEEFHVVLATTQESSPVWKNLLIAQKCMKKCIFAGDKIPLPEGTIQENAPHLVILRLDIRDGVDLSCFKTCVHLKHLSLGGRHDANESHHDTDDEEEAETCIDSEIYEQPIQLKNAKDLPLGLESLEIINLRTHKDDARVIALDLASLRDLTMKNLGWEGNLGLRLCDLVTIYERGQLNHFCIKASLNMMSFSELEEDSSSSPALNLFACVVQSNSFSAASRFFLEVWKRECGSYSTKQGVASSGHEEEELDVFQVPDNVELREEEEENSDSSGSSDEDSDDEDDDSNIESLRTVNSRDEEEEGVAGAGTDEDEWQECEDDSEPGET